MKISAAILLFLFLFSSFQPMPSQQGNDKEDGCSKKSCCTKMGKGKMCSNSNTGCSNKKTGKADSEYPCKNGCNPFMACAICCVYLVAEPQVIPSLAPLLKDKHVAFLQQFNLPDHLSDCWHPPEFV